MKHPGPAGGYETCPGNSTTLSQACARPTELQSKAPAQFKTTWGKYRNSSTALSTSLLTVLLGFSLITCFDCSSMDHLPPDFTFCSSATALSALARAVGRRFLSPAITFPARASQPGILSFCRPCRECAAQPTPDAHRPARLLPGVARPAATGPHRLRGQMRAAA